jgi:threonine/homoserine/homoserine lactone efflux protein
MPLHTIVLFFVAAMALTLAPGPDILTVVARSVAQGARAGIVATLGFATGLIFHTSAAALGLALVLRQSPAALRTIQYLGAAYLAYLAVRMFLGRDNLLSQPREHQTRTLWRIYGQSILMNVLNPKVTIFFLAFLTGYTDPTAPFPVPLQFVILGALFAVCTLLGFGACAVAAGQLSRFFQNHPRAHKPLRLATGALFLLIALTILATHSS